MSNVLQKVFFLFMLIAVNVPAASASDDEELRAIQNSGFEKSRAGDSQGAIGIFENGLKKAAASGNKRGESDFLFSLGQEYRKINKLTNSALSLEKARDIFSAFHDKKQEALAASELGAVYADMQRLSDAVKMHQSALAVFHELHDYKNESATLDNLAVNYVFLGEYASAVDCYGKSLLLQDAIGDIDERGRVYRKLGLIYARLGDYAQARDYYELALKDHKINYDRKEMADDNAALGRANRYLDDYRNAMKYFQRSISMNDAIQRTDYSVYDDIISLALDQDYAEDARKLIFSRSISSRPSAGRYYLYTNSYEEAKEVFQQCSDAAEKVRDAGNSIYCLTGLARSCEGLLDYDCAKRNYYKALEQGERVREGLAGERRTGFYLVREKAAWARTEPYEGLVRVSQFIRGDVRKSFYYSELLRERIFTSGYAALKYSEPAEPKAIPLPAAEVVVEYEVMEPYALVYVIKNGEIALTNFIEIGRKQLSELVGSYLSPFENIENTPPLSRFNPEAGKQLYDLLLKPVLEARDQEGNRLISKSAKIIIIPDEVLGQVPFEALVVSYSEGNHFKQGRFGPDPVGIQYAGDEYDLGYYYSSTVLAAQRIAKSKKRNSRDALLVLADPIFSSSDIRLPGTAAGGTKNGESGGKVSDAIVKHWRAGGKREGDASGDARDSLSFPRLAVAGQLVKSLAKTLNGKRVDALTGPAASKKELLGKDLSRYKYLVFATHGILDANVPYLREPALVLNQVNNRHDEEGFLTMSEILGLKLNAEVVVLTACRTGRGKDVHGAGVAAVGRAFQYAGAKSVLVSLWSVPEESSNLLVESFFRNVNQGKTARQSIRLAREHVRQAGYGHPYYWASFILHGE